MTASGERDGGAIRVNNGGHLNLKYSAIVGNDTGKSGRGGGIFFASNGSGSIESSVIAVNTAHEQTGGLYLEESYGTAGTVTLKSTIIANNESGQTNDDIYVGNGRTLTSQGNNRITTQTDNFTPHMSDHIGSVNYVVTSLADTWDGSSDPLHMSLRDAIHRANVTAGAQEIWLPAWDFILTRDRVTFGNGSPTDTSVAFGDLDIGKASLGDAGGSLTIRGIDDGTNHRTRVSWLTTAPIDRVFELLGDYDLDNTVESVEPPGNGDDDLDTGDANDEQIRSINVGHTLLVDDVLA